MLEYIKNNNLTNSLTKTQGKSIVKKCINKEMLVEHTYSYPNGDLTVQAPSGLFNNLNNATHKFFDIITIKATKERNKSVVVPITEFMVLRDLKDRQKAKAQAKEAIALLKDAEIQYTDKKHTYGFFRIIQSAEITKKNITVMFGDTFFEMLRAAPKMPYPMSLLALKDRYSPLTFTLVRKLFELANVGRDKIKVSSLLPYTDLPKVADVKNWKYKECIINPFERALNEAVPTILEWCYVDGEPNSIEKFLEAEISYTFVDYDYKARNERLEKTKPKAVENLA